MRNPQEPQQFTAAVGSAMRRARKEAHRNACTYIGSGHLLLGVAPDHLARRILAACGVDLADVRHAVDAIDRCEDGVLSTGAEGSPHVVRTLALATDEARILNRAKVGSGELLVGLVREGEGIAAQALAALGMSVETARLHLIKELVLAGRGQAGWRALGRGLMGAYSPDERFRLADQLKFSAFDILLHTRLGDAMRVAEFLEFFGSLAQQPRIVALGMLACADATRQSGNAYNAAALFLQSADLFLQAGDRVGWARALSGWLPAATEAGIITDGDLTQMDEVRRVFCEAGLRFRHANFEQNIGLALQWLGHYDEAIAAFDRGLAVLGPSSLRHEANLRGMLLMNKANTLLWQGGLSDAVALHRQACAVFTEIGNTGLAAVEQMNLSNGERLRGRLHEALQLARAAIEGMRQAEMYADAALALVYRADILLSLNRSDEALTDSAEAATLLGSAQLPCDLASALCMKARALLRCGDEVGALESLALGEQVVMHTGHLRIAYPITIERALLLISQGRAAEAREVALTVLRSPVTQETGIHKGMALLAATEASLALNDLTLARSTAEAVIQEGKELDAPEIVYRGHLILARIAVRMADLDSALQHYDQVAATLRTLVGDLVLDQCPEFLEDKDAVYMEALQVALDAGDAVRALGYLEQGRARAAWANPRRYDENDRGPVADDTLEALKSRHRYVSASMLTLRPDSAALTGAREELKRLARQIRDRLEAQARRSSKTAVFDAATLTQTLPEHTTLLAYALAGDDLVIFVVRRQEVSAKRVTGGARQLHRLARTLRLDIDTLMSELRSENPRDALAALGRQDTPMRTAIADLWSLLVAPVEPTLPADGAPLVIVPHGILHVLPLAALYDGSRYLAERWMVHCIPSCRAMTSPIEGMHAPNGPLLALGCSAENTLPNAPGEAREVARLMGGEAWTECEATSDRLRREGRGRGYLHIAAHGLLRLGDPNSSFVQLADGPFHPTDVSDLDLRGCHLVTLSACRTGVGRMSGGDEQIGLVRAFGYAGAEAVLATLWRVEDASTRTFMEHFYTRLAGGASPAAALRGTQLAFIHGDGEQAWRHPYFWAGFQLTEHAVRRQKSERSHSATSHGNDAG